MAKNKEEKRVFNLLKPVEPPATVWDKIHEWILGKARIVILLTELVIAVTFVLKVIEDTNAKNKQKEIENLNAEIGYYGRELEPIFRTTQRKSTDYISVWNQSNSYTEVLREIYSYITNPSSEITVRLDDDRVSVFGYEDLSALQLLEASLKASETFVSVQIQQLTLEESQVIEDKGQYALVAKMANFKREKL
jgi:hypothetical protein